LDAASLLLADERVDTLTPGDSPIIVSNGEREKTIEILDRSRTTKIWSMNEHVDEFEHEWFVEASSLSAEYLTVDLFALVEKFLLKKVESSIFPTPVRESVPTSKTCSCEI
jgi:hypothetical protein